MASWIQINEIWEAIRALQGGTFIPDFSRKSTNDLVEGSNNLYFTEQRVLDAMLGGFTTDYILFNTSYTPTGSEEQGTIYWDSDNNTFSGVLGNGVIGQVFKEQFFDGQNDTGVTIENGKVVQYASSIGNSGNIRIQLGQASSSENPFMQLGLATEDIEDGERGEITTFGKVRGIQTNGANYGETWSDGDILYVSPDTAGALTNVMPDAPVPTIPMAVVISAHASNGTLLVRPTFPESIESLSDVDGDLSSLSDDDGVLVKENSTSIWKHFSWSNVFNWIIGKQGDITKDPTGFVAPEDVIITGDSTTRTVTLTGTFNAYYRGVLNETIVSGWTSPAHDNTTTTSFFLYYDGSTIDWYDISSLTEDFYKNLLIAWCFYDGNNWIYQRECHGIMGWSTHREAHHVIGAYRQSGGTLGDYTLDSTTAADRRPSVSACLIYDEDLPTTNSALSAGGNYTQFYLSGTDTPNFDTTATDIVPLSGNRPYYNEWNGSAWVQTLMTNNSYMSVWLVATPTAADTNSQKLRFTWVQGQSNGSYLNELALNTGSLSYGALSGLTPETVIIARVIIKYTGGNWSISYVENITGTNRSQTSTAGGSYLSSVSTDDTLTGLGTPSSLLGQTPSDQYTADTPLDADSFQFWDAVDSLFKSITWSNIKATLKTYFDTLYQPKWNETTVTLTSGGWSSNTQTVTLTGATASSDVIVYQPIDRDEFIDYATAQVSATAVGTNTLTFTSTTDTTEATITVPIRWK